MALSRVLSRAREEQSLEVIPSWGGYYVTPPEIRRPAVPLPLERPRATAATAGSGRKGRVLQAFRAGPLSIPQVVELIGCTEVQAKDAVFKLVYEEKLAPMPGPRIGRTVYRRVGQA